MIDSNARLTMGQARNQNGDAYEMDLVSEECSELVAALHKHKRYNNDVTRDHVIEEIADVKIMIHQAETIMAVTRWPRP